MATPFLLVLMSAGHSRTTLAGADQRRRGGVAHGEGLHCTGAVAAGVGGRPEPRDDLGAAATVADAVAVSDGDRAAGIQGGGDAVLVGAGVAPGTPGPHRPGKVSAGGVVSRTVRVCTALVLLPQASVAVQRRADDLGAAATVADAVAVGDGDRAAGIRGRGTPFLLVLMSPGHSRTALAGQVSRRGGVAHGEGLHARGAVAAGVGGRPECAR